MTDYRKELLDTTLLSLHQAGVTELGVIKAILIKSISQYEITARCTDLAIIDHTNNVNVIKSFLATKMVEGGSKRTVRTRWSILQQFDKDVRKSFCDVTSFDILNWLAQLQQRVSLSTAEAYRSTLGSLFNWMWNADLIKDNPMKLVRPIRHSDPLKRSFTPVEVDALKTACQTKVDRAMVELLLSSGLRCEELCNLRWRDINFNTKDISVIEGKGNKNRVTMMDEITKKYLIEYRDSLDFTSEYVFAVKYGNEIKGRTTDSVWRKLKTIGKIASVPEVHPHKFRHTFATTLYKRGLDVRMIQKLLGHSNINTTMIYIDSDLEMLRDAYKRYA